MISQDIRLDLTLTEADANAEQLDDLTVRLMRDLRELGAESVERPAGGRLPKGAKGDPLTIGALAVVAVPAILPSLFGFLQAWALQGESRKVKIKTPAGLEVEFTPERKLSQGDLLALVGELSVSTQGTVAASEPNLITLSYLTRLRQLLSRHFDAGELRTLCFDLRVPYDNLPGDSKADKERELIAYLERRGRVKDLEELGKKLRPDVPWEGLPDAT